MSASLLILCALVVFSIVLATSVGPIIMGVIAAVAVAVLVFFLIDGLLSVICRMCLVHLLTTEWDQVSPTNQTRTNSTPHPFPEPS